MKKIFILSGSLIIIGTILIISGLFINRNQIFDENLTKTTVTYKNTNQTLDISDKDTKLIFKTSNDSDIHITYYESDTEDYTLENNSNEISILKETDYLNIITFKFSSPDKALIIELPTDYKASIGASTTNASIEMTDYNLNNLSLTTSNSHINLKNTNVKKSAVLQTTNGNITIDDTNSRSLNVTTTNSKIKLTDVSTKNKIEASTSNSDIILKNTVSDEIYASSSNDQINISNIKANYITLQTTNGEISGTIDGNKNDYTITSETSNGSNSLQNSTNGENILEVNTSNDDINVTFK